MRIRLTEVVVIVETASKVGVGVSGLVNGVRKNSTPASLVHKSVLLLVLCEALESGLQLDLASSGEIDVVKNQTG